MFLQGKFLPLCLYFGADGARKNYTLQLSNILEKGYEAIGERPQVLGELGIPMDLKSVALSISLIPSSRN